MAPVVVHALAVAPVGGAFIESAKIQSSPSHTGLLTYWLEGRVTEKARLFSRVICFCQLSSVFYFLLFKVFSLLDSKSFPVKFPVLGFANSLRLLRIHPQSYVNERQLLVEAYGQVAGSTCPINHLDIFTGHPDFC